MFASSAAYLSRPREKNLIHFQIEPSAPRIETLHLGRKLYIHKVFSSHRNSKHTLQLLKRLNHTPDLASGGTARLLLQERNERLKSVCLLCGLVVAGLNG